MVWPLSGGPEIALISEGCARHLSVHFNWNPAISQGVFIPAVSSVEAVDPMVDGLAATDVVFATRGAVTVTVVELVELK